jgi:hypothetical protein
MHMLMVLYVCYTAIPADGCIKGATLCDANAQCVSLSNGGFTCTCNDGYTGMFFKLGRTLRALFSSRFAEKKEYGRVCKIVLVLSLSRGIFPCSFAMAQGMGACATLRMLRRPGASDAARTLYAATPQPGRSAPAGRGS